MRQRNCHRRPVDSRNGISLIEMLVCIAVGVMALTSVSVVGAGMIDRVQVHAAVGEFRAAIQLARMHATSRAQRIDMLPVAGDWAQGHRVLVDANNNQRADPGEAVLHAVIRPAGLLKVSAALTDSGSPYLAFGPGGRPRTASSAAQPQFGSFLFSRGSQRRKLVLGFLGRTRSCDPDRDGPAC